MTNKDATRRVYNVTFPEKDYLYYSDNQFDLNASASKTVTVTIYTPVPTTIHDRFTYNTSDDGVRDPIRYRYNKSNESGLTFNAEQFPGFEVRAETYRINTSLETASLDHDFNLTFGEAGDSVFEVTNTGPETAYNVTFSGQDISFAEHGPLNLSTGEDTFIPYSVQLEKPAENATAATNQSYTRTINISGANFNTTTITVDVFVPYTEYREEEVARNLTEAWLDLREKTIQICQKDRFQDSPLCGGNIVKWRNSTEYINHTPVYQTNMTPAMREALRTVNRTDDRIQHLRERQDLLKQSVNHDIAALNQTLVTRLNRTVQYARQAKQIAEEAKQANQRAYQYEQQQRKTIAHQTMIVLVVLLLGGVLVGAAAGLYKLYQRQTDNRLIAQ